VTGDEAFAVQAAFEAQKLPPGHRWVSFSFDGTGNYMIGILAGGVERPVYRQVAVHEPAHAERATRLALDDIAANV